MVELDYTYYSGSDEYSDGTEDELLDVVQKYEEKEFPKLIFERGSWPLLYHLSEVRGNIIRWVEKQERSKVLEIGAGCGAVTGALADRFGMVHCVELSKKRSLVNANRNKNHDNIRVFVGNYQTIEPQLSCDYDAVTLIGVLEYARLYLDAEDPFRELLREAMGKLKSGGKLYIAIENKLGLKYFAGHQEDHLCEYYVGVEGYPHTGGPQTFSKKELTEMLQSLEDMQEFRFMYPYPDYKLPRAIYTDEYLPDAGDLNRNQSVSAPRLTSFDEQKVYRQLLKEGLYQEFANSFLIEITKR